MTKNLILPEHIVFSSGGTKGLAHVGVIKKMEELIGKEGPLVKNLNLKSISGSSIGSLVSTLVCIGYTANEILEETIKFDNNDFLRDSNMINILDKYGINSGVKLQNWIIDMINKKFCKEGLCATIDPTFMDLYKKTNIKLNITATSLNKGKTKYFNHEDTPDLEVSLAIKMSCSIPFIFEAVEYEGDLYVDGAIINDIPCDKIDDKENRLICKMEYKHMDLESYEINNLEDYSQRLLYCLFQRIYDLSKNKHNLCKETMIIVNSGEESSVNFDISNKDKKILFNNGYNSDFSKLKFFKEVEVEEEVIENEKTK